MLLLIYFTWYKYTRIGITLESYNSEFKNHTQYFKILMACIESVIQSFHTVSVLIN